MPAIRRSVEPIIADTAVSDSVRFVLADVGKALTELVSAQPKPKSRRRLVANRGARFEIGAALEKAFVRELLDRDNTEAIQRRLLLIRLLSDAELRSAHLRAEGTGGSFGDDEYLTSEEAAKLLHMSRTHVNGLLDAGKLGAVQRTEGKHRRALKANVLAYKEQSKARQAKGLADMMASSEELGLYEAEVSGSSGNRDR